MNMVVVRSLHPPPHQLVLVPENTTIPPVNFGTLEPIRSSHTPVVFPNRFRCKCKVPSNCVITMNRQMMKAHSVLAVLLLSLFSTIAQPSPELPLLSDASEVSGEPGEFASTAIPIEDQQLVNFTNTSLPYRWFSTVSLADMVYINITGDRTFWSGSDYGHITAYTSYTSCVRSTFWLSNTYRFTCINPSSDPNILFLIDFSDSENPTESRIEGNISLNITVEQGRTEPAQPPMPAPTADGDLYGDSSSFSPVRKSLQDPLPLRVEGTFEQNNDVDYVEFESRYLGTSRLVAEFNQSIDIDSTQGLDECAYTLTNGLSTPLALSSFPSGSIGPLVSYRGGLVFSASSASGEQVLWFMTDLAFEPLKLMHHLRPYSSPDEYTVVGDLVYFSAEASGFGRELWRTDGTPVGTYMVSDIAVGSSSSSPRSMVGENGRVFFSAEEDWRTGRELWMSDGTSSGTMLVKDIAPQSSDSNPSMLTYHNSTLFFRAQEGGDDDLWHSDGTENGTRILKEINPFYGSDPYMLSVLNGSLHFFARSPDHGVELWSTDGTENGTVMLTDMQRDSPSIGQLLEHGEDILLVGRVDATTAWGLYTLDPQQITGLREHDAFPTMSSSSQLIETGDAMFMSYVNASNNRVELHRFPSSSTQPSLRLLSVNWSTSYPMTTLIEGSSSLYFSVGYSWSDDVITHKLPASGGMPEQVDLYPMIPWQVLQAEAFQQRQLLRVQNLNSVYAFNDDLGSSVSDVVLDCRITSPTPKIGFSQGANNSNEEGIPWNWSVRVSTLRGVAGEDVRNGDSRSAQWRTPVPSNGVAYGSFQSTSDQDYFAIPIDHGTNQTITVLSKGLVQVGLSDTQRCELEQTDLNETGRPYLLQSVVTCDAVNMSDVVQFTLTSTNQGHEHPEPHYQINTESSTQPMFESSVIGNESSTDVPSLHMLAEPLSPLGVTGAFTYKSDTVDTYRFEPFDLANTLFTLKSNCATIQYAKSSYVDSGVYPGGNLRINLDTSVPNSPIYTIEVHRLYQTNELNPAIKSPCSYELSMTQAERSMLENVGVIHDLRLTTNEVLSIDEFNTSIDSNRTQSYSMTLPVDLSPVLNGRVTASQASNQPVEIHAYTASGSVVSELNSGTNTTYLGQNVEVGLGYLQWRTVRLTGLDGSPLTLQLEATAMPLASSRESSEWPTNIRGALGSSQDEGWDVEDRWTLNNSNDASYFSVQFASFTGTLNASMPTNGGEKRLSHFQCLLPAGGTPFPSAGPSDLSDPVALQRLSGDGEYVVRVRQGTGSVCPDDVTVSIPDAIPENSDFRIRYVAVHAYDVSFRLYDGEGAELYSTGALQSDLWHPINNLRFLQPGTYHWLIHNHDGVVIHEQLMDITATPVLTAQPTLSVLDVSDVPELFISAVNVHTAEPQPWAITNLQFMGVDVNGEAFVENGSDELEGFGSEVVAFNDLPSLLTGSTLSVTARVESNGHAQEYTWNWNVGFLRPVTTCESVVIYSPLRPENQVACTVSFPLVTHAGHTGSSSEGTFSGTMNVHNSSDVLVASVPFTSDRFNPTSVRIDLTEFDAAGQFSTTLDMDAEDGLYFTESTAGFEVQRPFIVEVGSDAIGEFSFDVLSIRSTAMGGDEVVLLWEAEGQPLSYMFINVYAEGQLVTSRSVVNDGELDGTVNVRLPDSINPFNDHSIVITAVSQFGDAVTRTTSLQGMSESTEVYLDTNPTQPTIGESFRVSITEPDGQNWLAWEWELAVAGAVIQEGNGFIEANRADFDVELPVAQYTSNPVLTVRVETKDGTVHLKTATINPLPMRYVNVELSDDLVVGEGAAFTWEVNGVFLNQMDNVQRIELEIYALSFELMHDDIFFGNSTKGTDIINLDESLRPGSYNLVARFWFADGTSFDHRESVQVLSAPEGLRFLGLTVPPLVKGLDTLLVVLLLVHAVFLQRRLRSKRASEGSDVQLHDGDADQDAYDNDNPYDDTPEMVDLKTLPPVPEGLRMEVQAEEPHYGVDQQATYGYENTVHTNSDLYQEYPIGSGTYWQRSSPYDEWELVE